LSGFQGVLLFAFHWLEYLGLLGGLGSFVVRRLGRMGPRIAWANPPMHLAFGAAVVGGLGLLVMALLIGGASGWLAARVVAEAIAFTLCVRGNRFVAPFAMLAAVLLPLAGHAAAVQPPAGAELADAVHVLSAGMWAGGILALAALRPPDGWRGPDARVLLDRFGGVALVAFAITALTGVLRAIDVLHDVSELWTTTYGVVLVLKMIGVAIMLVLTPVAWHRGAWPARAEAAIVLLVVGATALLATLPLPPPATTIIELVRH
jgi:putative copper export protein